VPEGTTKEQFRLMLQNLLAERFGLQAHHESKEMPIYALVVAKNGSKLKESAPAAVADEPQAMATTASGRPKFELGKDGFPILPLGTGVSMIMMNGRARSRWPGYTLKQLAVMLSGQVGKPVTDASGLTGKYDITLSWADDGARGGAGNPPAPADGGAFPVAGTPDADALPNIFAAIQEQLGLKLEAKKGMVDILVIDHVEKTPSDN
jgi:uncharacterized protein (TIGR03435 family)